MAIQDRIIRKMKNKDFNQTVNDKLNLEKKEKYKESIKNMEITKKIELDELCSIKKPSEKLKCRDYHKIDKRIQLKKQ